MTKQIWRLKGTDGVMASQEIFIIVQIVVHAFKWIEALCLMDGRFMMLFDKHNKTDEFTELFQLI